MKKIDKKKGGKPKHLQFSTTARAALLVEIIYVFFCLLSFEAPWNKKQAFIVHQSTKVRYGWPQTLIP